MINDLFPGWTFEELARLLEHSFSAVSILCAAFVVGIAR
jgi:hypothetical protein